VCNEEINFDYRIWILNFSSLWWLATSSSIVVDALQILLSSHNFDVRSPSFSFSTTSFQKLGSMDFRIVGKSKWTLIITVEILRVLSNSTKSLIISPSNTTISQISNNLSLNPIYNPKRNWYKKWC
jgi:hypothetical protein